jgi:CheY-like chemotaxis protein
MTLRVLVVEDEAVVAMLLEDMLMDLGHDVAAAAGRFEQAMEAASGEAIDLAILDLNLNGTLTYPIAEVLRGRGVPVVFATGYGAEGLREDWRSSPVIQKPFQLRDLQKAIGKAVPGVQPAG